MKWLVDANVLSEPTRPRADGGVVAWLRLHEADLAVDPVILGEIRFGILLLPRGRRRAGLESWFDGGVARLRCLAWDAAAGLRWAALLADLRARGEVMPVRDSIVATTALMHDLTVVTRNVKDFRKARVPVFDPFAS